MTSYSSNSLTNPPTDFPLRAFLLAILINTLWINASEVFRYFVFVMPMIRDTLAVVPDVAPISIGIFAQWGIWDTILVFASTGFTWLYLERFGSSIKQAVFAATLIWLAVFVIFWLAMYNMNLATPAILAIAWPLSWLEMLIAALIVRWVMQRHQQV